MFIKEDIFMDDIVMNKVSIIEKHLKDFKDFKKVILQKFCFKK